MECFGKIQKEAHQAAVAWLSHADNVGDAGSGVLSSVDLKSEGQQGWPFDGWPLLQLDSWCDMFLDDGDFLDLDVNLGASGWGRVVLSEVVVKEKVDQGDDHAGQVHPVPGVDQLVDYSRWI